MSDRDFITTIYDELLSDAGEAMCLSDIRTKLVPEVVAMLAERPRDLEREAERLVSEHLAPIRQSRSNSLRRDLEYVLDFWVNPEEAADVRPILARAYKLGTQNGEDKTLQFWTRDDLMRSSMFRYREAADVMRAAREFDATVNRVITQMGMDGRSRLGDDPGLGRVA